MSRLRILSGTARAVAGLALLLGAASACGEDGKTAPDKCKEPPLPIFDIQLAGAPNVDNPCVTQPGFAISGTTTSAGTSSAAAAQPTGGTSSGGTAGGP